MISKILRNLSIGIFLALALAIFTPVTEANAQVLLHDSRLKTKKQEKKTNRKSLFIKRESEDSKKEKTEVRTSERRGRKKDKRELGKPSYEEGSHRLDTDEKEYNRPVSPETTFGGRRKAKDKKNPNKEFSSFGGNLKSSSVILKPQRGISNSNKGSKGKSENQLKKDFEQKSQRMHQYSGTIKIKDPKRDRNPNKNASFYTGNLKSSSNIIKPQRGASQNTKGQRGKSEKRIRKEFEEDSKERHQYTGKIKIPSPSTKTKHFKKLSKNVHQYGGDIRIKRSRHKDLHPSVSYLEGKKKNSHEQKEKLRKRKVFWFKFWRNGDQPKVVKEKPEKPKYDSRESEIWYE